MSSPPTSIDLFAGCGGLTLGLHDAGWEGLFAIEKDPMAFETLSTNLLGEESTFGALTRWPEWLARSPHDLAALLADPEARARVRELRGQVTLVAGGPPCQGFSVGGARNGDDKRNQLVNLQLQVVELARPPLVVVENVEGIARRFVSKPGENAEISVASYVVGRLGELGYASGYLIVDASRFGVPQVRRRVFIIGVDREVGELAEPPEKLLEALMEERRLPFLHKLGLAPDSPVTVSDALDDLSGGEEIVCGDSPKFTAGRYSGRPRSPYAKAMRAGVPVGELPQSHRYTKHGERISTLYRLAHATQPAGRLSKAFLVEQGTKKDKKVLLDPAAPSSTITTHPDEFIHHVEPRNVTVREMARLQSFPDRFTFHGRYTINGPRRKHDVARCSQVGNAVPPHLAQALGGALIELLAVTRGQRRAPVLEDREPVPVLAA